MAYILRFVLAALAVVGSELAVTAADLAEALRKAFELPGEAQVIWPPHAGLRAGSVVDKALRVIAHEDRSVSQLAIQRDPFTIALSPEQLLPVGGLWIWRSFLGDSARLAVELKLSNPEIVSLESAAEATEPLVRKVDAEKVKGSNAVVTVQRSWMANVVLEIAPAPEMSRTDWLDMRRAALGDQTRTVKLGKTANSIVLTVPERVAFAIELGPSAIGKKPAPEGKILGPKRWALATIASGRYQFLAGMDQDWNVESADLIADALRDWRPSFMRALKPADSRGLSRSGVLSFLESFAQEAKKAKAELLVVYYVGHMERTGTGGLSLLMGDAPAERKIRSPAPATGIGNLRELMQIVDQAEAELAPQPGSLDVAVIHRQLGKIKLPFVLLVDGCLQDPSYDEARERLGIMVDARGGEPVYVGPGDAGTALREQIAKLQAYPQDFPWLRSKNPTVLGATPGTVAYAATNPVWAFGGPVGPIARRVFDVVARTRWDADRPNLIRILNFAAERQSVGPQELVGTVSWSDWLPYLRRFDPASFK